ncbi:S8 family peptidase [Aliiroseovarius sediminis]|uniref:S8 family peptidase n=1 Tax=Aliiroseovarius sediminis TaxID=2925839 RepID=UPI001F58367A|nr:S8 family peptidase [uncultured Aliiroseovarius sp.]MCI2395732.1 S8 family peptidase [Aliiroseovarius sediminis]
MAERNLPHLVLNGVSRSEEFRGRGGRGTPRPSAVQNRQAHAQRLIASLDAIQVEDTARATYIAVQGRPGEPFLPEKFDVSGLSLLNTQDADADQRIPGRAIVKANRSEGGLSQLKGKLREFAGDLRPPNQNGVRNPYHADLANGVGLFAEIELRDLWRHPTKPFPEAPGQIPWEVWLEPGEVDQFVTRAVQEGLAVYPDRLEFPEDTVILVEGDVSQMARTAIGTGSVRAVSPLGAPIDFVDGLEAEEQADWLQDVLGRTQYGPQAQQAASYVTLLDTGITLAHPLIQPAFDAADRHAAVPGWDLADLHGHGSRMAGATLFGDLRTHLNSTAAINVPLRLESAKVIPDAGHNPYHLLGDRTQKAINAVEVEPDRLRTFALATTTDLDTPHSGAPTSWSTELDQLAAGRSGEVKQRRLIVTSIGNIDAQHDGNTDYLSKCDDLDEGEVQSPSQAWNSIAVGAMTEMNGVGGPTHGAALAEVGDLAPMSRTASWTKTWPIKPDVVLEGGNWYDDGFSTTPNQHSDLMLVTTSRNYPARSFTHISDTSAATALAAREIALLRASYPDLWPETIRALYVASAQWTDRMWSHIAPADRNRKGAYDVMFTRYGYGQPNLERALNSASSAITMIVEDSIRPYENKGSGRKLNEMQLFELPWPTNVLRSLVGQDVTLRVALSTFIEPNPSEVARGRKNRYASHGLRFALKGADEEVDAFTQRVGRTAVEDQPDDNGPDSGEWDFGYNRRSVGSLHIDTLTVAASDLARRGVLAVYPVGGWWKENRNVDPERCMARFSLVVEIDATEAEVDLYAEVQQKVAPQAEIQV